MAQSRQSSISLQPGSRRLASWKEIGAYLGCEVRTAQRWERTEGLPIHRHVHGKGSSIYAYTAELDAWRESRNAISQRLTTAQVDLSVPSVTSAPTLSCDSSLPDLSVPARASRRVPVWVALASAFTAILIAASIALHFIRQPHVARDLNVIPLADALGDQYSPTFSPDGREVAFVWNGSQQDNFDIYVKLIGSPSVIRLTSSPMVDYSPAWSPDGRWIAFCRAGDTPGGAVWIVPALGGPERKVIDLHTIAVPAIQMLSWSPDGRWLVVAGLLASRKRDGLSLVNVFDGKSTPLTEPPPGQADMYPAFSPDGRTVAFTRDTGNGVSAIEILPFRAGSPLRERPRKFGWSGFQNVLSAHPAWTPDSTHIVFESDRGGKQYLWLAAADSSDAPIALESLGDSVGSAAISKNGQLAFVHQLDEVNIWKVGLQNVKPPIQPPAMPVITSTRRSDNPRISPDGKRVAFASNRGGYAEIWMSQIDGSNAIPITSLKNPVTGSPSWSPDGRHLVFDSRVDGRPELYVVSANGGEPRRLTLGTQTGFVPYWSVDGKWIYYSCDRTGQIEIYRIPAAGGQPKQMTHGGGFAPVASADGEYLYYGGGMAPIRLWQLDLKTGSRRLIASSVLSRAYAPAANGVYFFAGARYGKQALYFFDNRSHATRFLLNLDNPLGFGIALAPDGHSLYYTQVDQSGHDLRLAEHFWHSGW